MRLSYNSLSPVFNNVKAVSLVNGHEHILCSNERAQMWTKFIVNYYIKALTRGRTDHCRSCYTFTVPNSNLLFLHVGWPYSAATAAFMVYSISRLLLAEERTFFPEIFNFDQ